MHLFSNFHSPHPLSRQLRLLASEVPQRVVPSTTSEQCDAGAPPLPSVACNGVGVVIDEFHSRLVVDLNRSVFIVGFVDLVGVQWLVVNLELHTTKIMQLQLDRELFSGPA